MQGRTDADSTWGSQCGIKEKSLKIRALLCSITYPVHTVPESSTDRCCRARPRVARGPAPAAARGTGLGQQLSATAMDLRGSQPPPKGKQRRSGAGTPHRPHLPRHERRKPPNRDTLNSSVSASGDGDGEHADAPHSRRAAQTNHTLPPHASRNDDHQLQVTLRDPRHPHHLERNGTV